MIFLIKPIKLKKKYYKINIIELGNCELSIHTIIFSILYKKYLYIYKIKQFIMLFIKFFK